ncbi:hypothetical protein L9F63_007124 [Diploptera punctata]|uniref:Ig-like domain-containing protein n=1 Tax=Diploptera punctata TaxID=6984 RepID=A0AAD7Z8Q0_DIPPU|nr:hypothetical protein L9F63_007124 [Diploptera punctata]
MVDLFVTADSITANYDQESTRYKTIDFNIPLELQCNTTESDVRLEWYKDDKNITDSKGKVKIKDNKLIIEKPKVEDAGNYTCKAFKTKVNATVPLGEKQIEVIVKPQVAITKDVTVVEGEKLKLECLVYGTPQPQISWRFGNETFTGDTERVKLEPHEGVANAALVIKETRMEDRGIYVCIGTSGNSTDEAQCHVRVKDKLAALWPFLGICVEVIVLCAIILIYEKKRNKTELEESDTDNSPETKNTPDHGKDSVRQRK